MEDNGGLWIAKLGVDDVGGAENRLVDAGWGGVTIENPWVIVTHPIAATRSRKESSLEIILLIVESSAGMSEANRKQGPAERKTRNLSDGSRRPKREMWLMTLSQTSN